MGLSLGPETSTSGTSCSTSTNHQTPLRAPLYMIVVRHGPFPFIGSAVCRSLSATVGG